MKRIAEFDHIEFANVSTPLGLYAGGEEVPFGNMPTEVGDFKTQLKEKSKNYSFDRDVLHTVLKDQYKELKLSDSQLYNLELLKSKNTFTITTGHQLNIFGGPVYMLYKIIHVIKTRVYFKSTN